MKKKKKKKTFNQKLIKSHKKMEKRRKKGMTLRGLNWFRKSNIQTTENFQGGIKDNEELGCNAQYGDYS